MAKFTPQVSYTTQESIVEYRTSISTNFILYPTYRQLVADMNSIIKKSIDGVAYVSRSRRGEWGEWFEVWQEDSFGKPAIVKQGWM
jgi:hypothetical protein